MRKLKLQVQLTLDGFMAGPHGELDWMTWNWDDGLKAHVTALTDSVDAILLGRKMTDGFIGHWSAVAQRPEDPEYAFAKKMMEKPRVVFSRSLKESAWENTSLAGGLLADEIGNLKNGPGGDLIVYGGVSFVASLIAGGHIDEYHLFLNPVVIGAGMAPFGQVKEKRVFRLVRSDQFECGVVCLQYEPA